MIGLSIVIPTLNEASCISALIANLVSADLPLDIIVVDGGSADATLEKLRNQPVTVLGCQPGRGAQLLKGIQHARYDIVWLLHADSGISSVHICAIAEAMEDKELIGGNFAIEFDGGDEFSLWLNRFYQTIRKRGFYYGDSGIFIRRDELNNLDDLGARSLMEDYALVRKMEKDARKTVCITKPKIVTSSRRFSGRSKRNIICGWIVIHLMYYLKFPDAYLVKVYNCPLFTTRSASRAS